MIPLNRNLSTLQRSPIRAYTNLARTVPDCVLFTIGEPDFDTPTPIRDAAIQSLRQNRTHYSMNQGDPALRQAVADFETARGNCVTSDQVLITVGACQALFTALVGILNPGEEVIVPTPAFPLYETVITIAGGKMIPLDISKTDFQIDPQALNDLITPNTKAILINSPCNPSGTVFSEESLQCVKQAILGKPIFLIADNVYSALSYVPCPDLSTDPQLQDQCILCQSFSKPYAMTGWRVGYLTCPDYVMDRLLLFSAAQITAVPTFVQDAAITALATDPAPMVDAYQSRRDYVCTRLRQMGLPFPQPEGAFYVFPSIAEFSLSSDEFCRRMILEAGVAAVPGSCFGCAGHIRLSYCCSDAQLKKGLDRMEQFLAALRKEASQ